MRRLFLWGAALLVLITGVLVANRVFSRALEIPRIVARRGELLISLQVTGQVDAKRAYTITAPRIRNIQITWLAQEGSLVQAGDPVIKFDSSQQQQELADQESQLKISEKALERARQEYAIQEKQLALELRQAQRNYDEKKHEAPKIAEEAKLQLDVAELKATRPARSDQVPTCRRRSWRYSAPGTRWPTPASELEQMTLSARRSPAWRSTSTSGREAPRAKVQDGDSPWPGQGLVNLPDLGEMIAESHGFGGRCRPSRDRAGGDHFARRRFRTDVSGQHRTQGHARAPQGGGSQVNVFDVEIADPRPR